MNTEDLKTKIRSIVEKATVLKNKYIDEAKIEKDVTSVERQLRCQSTVVSPCFQSAEKMQAHEGNNVDNKNAPVNYACIFSQTKKEYDGLVKAAQKIGKIVKETPTGPLFQIKPLQTISGTLKLLKIRIPDPTRPEIGDADFTISNFSDFKKKYLSKSGFKLIKREGFEMIELVDSEFDVRAYFSNPPLDAQLKIK